MPSIALVAVDTALQTELVSKHNCVVNVLNESYKIDSDTILYVDKNHINPENIKLVSTIRYCYIHNNLILCFFIADIFVFIENTPLNTRHHWYLLIKRNY